ncbi:MAG: RING finger protein [Oscillospiraceae bacterium]
MSRFTDKLCPVCRTKFADGDDIVVCPECGTPHHRECYKQTGKCGVEEYHAQGFVWNGALPDQPEESSPEQADSAQTEDTEQAFCTEQPDEHHAELPDYNRGSSDSGTAADAERVKNFDAYFEMYKRIHELTDDEKRGEDGVSSKELCHFAGKSVIHYSQAFAAFRIGVPKNGKIQPVKVFLNFCAGFFAPIHQFYRGMIPLGIALVLFSAITSIPDCLLLFDNQNIGFQLSEATVAMLDNLSIVCSIANFAQMMLLCVFGDYIYYKFCVRRIKKIRANYDDGNADGYYAALTADGSPSKLRVVIGILALLLVSQIVYYAPAFFLA